MMDGADGHRSRRNGRIFLEWPAVGVVVVEEEVLVVGDEVDLAASVAAVAEGTFPPLQITDVAYLVQQVY